MCNMSRYNMQKQNVSDCKRDNLYWWKYTREYFVTTWRHLVITLNLFTLCHDTDLFFRARQQWSSICKGSAARSCSVNRRPHVALIQCVCTCVCTCMCPRYEGRGGGAQCVCVKYVIVDLKKKKKKCVCVPVCMHVCCARAYVAYVSCTESVLAFSMPSELGITVWWDFFPHVDDVCKSIHVQFVCKRQMVKPQSWFFFFFVQVVLLCCWIRRKKNGVVIRRNLSWPGQSFLAHICNCCKNWTRWLRDTQIKKNSISVNTWCLFFLFLNTITIVCVCDLHKQTRPSPRSCAISTWCHQVRFQELKLLFFQWNDS